MVECGWDDDGSKAKIEYAISVLEDAVRGLRPRIDGLYIPSNRISELKAMAWICEELTGRLKSTSGAQNEGVAKSFLGNIQGGLNDIKYFHGSNRINPDNERV